MIGFRKGFFKTDIMNSSKYKNREVFRFFLCLLLMLNNIKQTPETESFPEIR